MKAVYWKIKYDVAQIMIGAIWLWYFIKRFIPYETAKVHMAYRLYQQTPMYRERLKVLGPDFARDTFVEYGDYKLFLHKLTRKDKIRAFFMPYSYISKDTIL